MMDMLRRQTGFTLVELAIVLVIIGVILGAVLKGQDLIEGARTKKMINDTGRKFEVAAWSYYDRRGRFPGDSNRDGIIGSTGDVIPFRDYTGARLSLMPTSPVVLGSSSFFTFYGHDNNNRNVIIICKEATCNGTFNESELDMVRAFDIAIDGNESGTAGSVRSATTATGTTGTDPNFDWSGTVSGVGTSDWAPNTHEAIAYYFDRRP